jgi:hypothetical protein
LLALLAATLSWAGPLTRGASAAAPAIKNCTTSAKGALLAYYANDALPPKGANKALVFWHPMEIEFVFKDGLFHVSAEDTAYFAGAAGTVSQFKKDFGAASAAAATGVMDGAKTLSATVRPKTQKDAAAAKDGVLKSTALNAFSDGELRFLECRMMLTGNDAAFQIQRGAAHANADALGKFVSYWRAFMADELTQYAAESKALAPGSPAVYVSLHDALVQRTADAVAKAGKGPFTPTGPVIPPVQGGNACAKLPVKPAEDMLSQDECNLLSDAQQKQYVNDQVGASDPAAIKTVVAKYRALAAQIKNPFPDKGTDATLSATEAKYMSDADQKDYLAKLAKAPSNPKWKLGDAEDGSKEALTLQDRNSLNNLGKDELTALGVSSVTMKAQIEALAPGSEDRLKMVKNDRQLSAAILHNKSVLPPGFKNAQDLAQYLVDNPNNRECVWTGNCNNGTVSGPGNVGAGGTAPGTGPGTGSTAPDQPNIQGPDTGKKPPIPDQVDAKDGKGGMAAFKKDLPAIGNGIRMGIWAAILGFFVAGPAGVLMFGLCGAAAGFGITKINGIIGS